MTLMYDESEAFPYKNIDCDDKHGYPCYRSFRKRVR